MTLTEEQKQAILEQSKGMTDTEKQKFAADIRAAQEREAAKQQQKQAAEASKTAFKWTVSNEKPKEDVTQSEEKTNAPTNNNIASWNIPWITPEPTQAPAPIKKEEAPAVWWIPGVTSEAPYTGPITNIEEFKKSWGTLDNLSSLITNAYWAEGEVSIKGNVIYWTKNGKPTKWIIDDAGNPIATTLSIDEANKAGMGIEKLSSETIFKKLLNDEEIPSMYQDTSEYKVAKDEANKWKMLDKSEGGLYSAIKNLTLDNTLLNEIYNSPITKEAYDKANKRVIEEKIKNWKAEDVVNMTISELEQYVKNKNTSFYWKTFEERINENTDIATYKKQYLDGLEKASDIKVKIDWLKDNIRRRFPNATEGFINAMYKREAWALTEEYNQAVADANLWLGAYNFSIGEIEKLEQYEAAEWQKMEASFNSIFEKQADLFTTEEKLILQNEYAVKKEVELNEVKKEYEQYTSQIDKNGDLVFFDKQWVEQNRIKDFDLEKTNIVTKEEILSNWEKRINKFDKSTWEYIWSYVLWEWVNEWKIFWWVEIKDVNWKEVLSWDFQRNIDLERPEGSTNVARDTNNPWNITVPNWYTDAEVERLGRALWANWTYTSPNWREYFTFPNVEKWALWMKDMIARQVEWNSSWATPSMTIEEYIIWYERWPKYITDSGGDWTKAWVPKDYYWSIMDDLWTQWWETLKSLNSEDIANAIAKAEWFWEISGINWWTVWSTWEEAEVKSLIKWWTEKERTELFNDYKKLRQEWFSHEEALRYTTPENSVRKYKDETTLRKEFNNFIWKDTLQAVKQSNKIEKILSTDASGPWDMAAIFAFMKSLDPTSVVRESEYAAAQETAWVFDRTESLQLLKKWENWQILTEQQRKDFIKITKVVLESEMDTYNKAADKYRIIAEQSWFNPDNIIILDTTENILNDIDTTTEEKTVDNNDPLWIFN